MSTSCSHRVPGVVLIGNAAAKGSAVNGTGPEARADVHRTSPTEMRLMGEEARGGNTEATLDGWGRGRREEDGHR